MTRHGFPFSTSLYSPARTADMPERAVAPNVPWRIFHDSAKLQTPYVDPVDSFCPPCRLHGQTASQLHASKYEPETRQAGGMGSDAELPEVVVDVAVAPEHPLIARHRAETGMPAVRRAGHDEAAQQVERLLPVAFELDRLRAADRLIDLRRRRHAVRPRHHRVQRDPLHD